MTPRDYAIVWTERMGYQFAEETKKSVAETRVYDSTKVTPKKKEKKTCDVDYELRDYTTHEGLRYAKAKYPDAKVAALDFASYRNPGGGFLNGATSQEEMLCRESNLYNILMRFNTSYYKENREDGSGCMYRNRALYVPDVQFVNHEEINTADVIVCASPNYTATKRLGIEDPAWNSVCLSARIGFIFDVAEAEKVDCLVLGAFGCGAFGQTAEEVAEQMFYEMKHHNIPHIIYAVPDYQSRNYIVFEEAGRKEKAAEAVRKSR